MKRTAIDLFAERFPELPAVFLRMPISQLEPCAQGFELAVRGWRPRAGSMILSGPTGSGKTAAAVLALRGVLAGLAEDWGTRDEDASPAAWISAPRLSWRLREQRFGEPIEALAVAASAPVLFLDDLGGETPDALRLVGEVADCRYSAGLPTLITTWLEAPALIERYSEATLRRFLMAGGKRGEVVVP